MAWPLAGVVAASALATLPVLTIVVLAASAEPADSAPPPPSCAMAGARLSVAQGPRAMSLESWVVRVVDTSPTPCVLPQYPTVRAAKAADSSGPLAVGFLARAGGVPTLTVPVTPRVVLRSGQTAAAWLESSDAADGIPTCTRAHAVVTMTGGPGTVPSARVNVCSTELDVSPFLLGFDGASTGGEVVGTAPACRWSASERRGQLGPVVRVDAWSGTKLANFAELPAVPTATTPFRLDLRPGPYRITAPGETSRRIVVRPGFVTGLGPYGRCSRPGPTPTTVPGSGRTTSTTSP